MKEEVLYTSSKAAAILHEQLPDKTAAQWATWLHNNRNNPAHGAIHKVPFERAGKSVLYRADDLATFVEFEKSKRIGTMKLSGRAAEALRAVGFGEAAGSTTGRKLECTLVAARDEAGGKNFAQLIIRNPFVVFRLEPEQVRELATEFADMATAFDRWSKA